MSLLGIDVGTGGCKAAAFSEDGSVLASAYRAYPTRYPGEGRMELDSCEVWGAVQSVIRETASRTREDPISALSVSAMGEAATPVTHDRQILGPCILSGDTRGGEYVEELRSGIGQEAFYRINPNILAPHYTFPKLRWIKEREPELYERADLFLLWGGLVEFLLGCEPCVNHSHANRTLLFDIRQEDWSTELLNAAKLDREKLPRCVPGGTVIGIVSRGIATELGLPDGVRVVAGGHDQCCNALGAGIAKSGRAVDGIGTFECITPVYSHIPEPEEMLRSGLNIEHHVLPGQYCSFLYNQGGSLVRWFYDTFAASEKDTDGIYDRLASEMPVEPTRLVALPYFEPTGSPGYVSDASGVILGLKTSTARGEILKAIMESVTYYFADSIERLGQIGIDTTEFVATGGGAKSDAWLQIKADIFGVPFVRPAVTECGVLGAAILSGTATRAFASTEEGVRRCVRRDRTFDPSPRRHAIYRERLAKYRTLFPILRGYLSEWEGMQA